MERREREDVEENIREMENTRQYKGQQSMGQKTREHKKKIKTVYISNNQKRLLQNKKITKKTRLPCTKN